MANEYEGFSKQDLLDRQDTLIDEYVQSEIEDKKLLEEIKRINKLLEEKK